MATFFHLSRECIQFGCIKIVGAMCHACETELYANAEEEKAVVCMCYVLFLINNACCFRKTSVHILKRLNLFAV